MDGETRKTTSTNPKCKGSCFEAFEEEHIVYCSENRYHEKPDGVPKIIALFLTFPSFPLILQLIFIMLLNFQSGGQICLLVFTQRR